MHEDGEHNHDMEHVPAPKPSRFRRLFSGKKTNKTPDHASIASHYLDEKAEVVIQDPEVSFEDL